MGTRLVLFSPPTLDVDVDVDVELWAFVES